MDRLRRWQPALGFVGIAVLLTLQRPNWHPIRPQARAGSSSQRLSIPSNVKAMGSIDSWNGMAAAVAQSGTHVKLTGWVLATAPDARVLKVSILVDGQPIGETSLFQPRPDLTEAFGRSDLSGGGWQTTVKIPPLAPGQHKVTLLSKFADRGDASVGPFPITILD